MRAIWVLARKELRLLMRDRMAAGLLVGMPLLFILVLGLLLGEGFGQAEGDKLRVSIIDLDEGTGLDGKRWSYWVRKDLAQTPGIRIEIIHDRNLAEQLIRDHRRAAILILEPDFSENMNRCSFLDVPGGINPFYREGVYLDRVRATLLKDETQSSAAALIEQVVQVTMLRVILPFVIGEAFEKLSEPHFIDRLSEAVKLPMPQEFKNLLSSADALLKDGRVMVARQLDKKLDTKLKEMEKKIKDFAPLIEKERIQLAEMIDLAAGKNAEQKAEFQAKIGDGVQEALKKQFSKYNLTGKTWASLTKAQTGDGDKAQIDDYEERDGSGLLKRGAHRYQILVPAYTVMFAFFLVLTVGWIFVAERRQGTLKRLRAAPLSRAEILLGKLLPCYLISVSQGLLLLLAGRLLFGMRWGPDDWSWMQQTSWLLLVVLCTSLAAMGLAVLVAALARSEVQVALYGAVPVLVLALIGGCVLPRELMPEQTQWLSLLTPQGWALNAYRELLSASGTYEPNLAIVLRACAILAAFGVIFLAAAWALLRLE